MLKDRILAGSIAGMIATLVMAVPNFVLWKFGIIKYLYFHVAASALTLPHNISTPLGITVGIIADVITGGTIGIIAILLLKFFGRDYWWYKGLIVGSLIWLWGFGVMTGLCGVKITSVQPLFQLTSLVDHLIFGFILTYLIVKWYPAE